jgi:hypothetical protein
VYHHTDVLLRLERDRHADRRRRAARRHLAREASAAPSLAARPHAVRRSLAAALHAWAARLDPDRYARAPRGA